VAICGDPNQFIETPANFDQKVSLKKIWCGDTNTNRINSAFASKYNKFTSSLQIIYPKTVNNNLAFTTAAADYIAQHSSSLHSSPANVEFYE